MLQQNKPLLKSTFLTATLLVSLILACPAQTTAADQKKQVPATPASTATPDRFYQQVRDVTVEILVNGRISGMGTFVKEDGHLISVGHLFKKPGERIEILSTAIGRHEAKIVAVDRGHDLALLRVVPNAKEKKLSTPVIPLAKAMPKSPEQIYQFGAPICRRGVLQSGTVARNETTFEYLDDQKATVEVFHVCATIQQGTSGGPWLDREGRLVGVQSATMLISSSPAGPAGMMLISGPPAGIAFVAPLSAVKQLIKTKKTASTATLGIAVEELWQQSSTFIGRFPQGTEGIVLKMIHKDGPADRAGLKEMDVVLRIDGKRVRWVDDFLKAVRLHKPGEKVELELLLPGGAGKETVKVSAAHLEVTWVKAEE